MSLKCGCWFDHSTESGWFRPQLFLQIFTDSKWWANYFGLSGHLFFFGTWAPVNKNAADSKRFVYLWFLPKQPQFVLGSAHWVFGVGPLPWGPVSLPLSFRCVADGAVRPRSAQILTEVLKGEVTRRLKARLKWLHNNGWVLRRRVDGNRRTRSSRHSSHTVRYRLVASGPVHLSYRPLPTLRSSTALAAETIPSRHLDTMGMTRRSASAKLR